MEPMRVFYQKTGTAKYISHLDINRCFQRAMKRAGIPLWFTEGFNPHAYLTFPLPLALGYESLCECVDFRLVGEMAPEEIIKRLNDTLPAGLRAYGATPPVYKAADIALAAYEVRLTLADTDVVQAQKILEAFFAQPQITTMKRTKKGEREISLKEHLHDLTLGAAEGEIRLDVLLPAGSELNINPTLVLDAFGQQTGMMIDRLAVKKTAVFTQDKKNFA
ncbi:MAG: TIGR03936 family radical SAM-associated protein [Oscillospiraceae bacterium]|nr:TIGR03936 family radical SAM-associated protein [Oscillospiraceae bacterium]